MLKRKTIMKKQLTVALLILASAANAQNKSGAASFLNKQFKGYRAITATKAVTAAKVTPVFLDNVNDAPVALVFSSHFNSFAGKPLQRSMNFCCCISIMNLLCMVK